MQHMQLDISGGQALAGGNDTRGNPCMLNGFQDRVNAWRGSIGKSRRPTDLPNRKVGKQSGQAVEVIHIPMGEEYFVDPADSSVP
jgi:hypothetical protein